MHGMRDMAGLSLGRGHGVATCSLRTTRDSTQLQHMFNYKTNLLMHLTCGYKPDMITGTKLNIVRGEGLAGDGERPRPPGSPGVRRGAAAG